MTDVKFYRCSHCGNIITKLTNSGVPVVCCGESMTLLEANTNDAAATEKHVPVVETTNGLVTANVGAVDHPMAPDHFIEWIYLVTTRGEELVRLQAGEAPRADFTLTGGAEIVAVYAYCNLHGLWKA